MVVMRRFTPCRRVSWVVVAALLAGLLEIFGVAPAAQAAPSLASNVVVMDSSWQSTLQSAVCTDTKAKSFVPCASWSLAFTDPSPASSVTVGTILMSDSSAKLPNGFLDKVASITTNGGVTTITATLAQVSDALKGDFSQSFSNLAGTAYQSLGATTKSVQIAPRVKLVPPSLVPKNAFANPGVHAPHGMHLVGTKTTGETVSPSSTVLNCLTPDPNKGLYFQLSGLQIPMKDDMVIAVQGWYYLQPALSITQVNGQDTFTMSYVTDASVYLTVNSTQSEDFSNLANFDVKLLEATTPPVLEKVVVLDALGVPVPILVSVKFAVTLGLQGELLVGLTYEEVSGFSQDYTVWIDKNATAHVTASPFKPDQTCINLYNSNPSGTLKSAGLVAGYNFQIYLFPRAQLLVYNVLGIGIGPSPFIQNLWTATVPFNWDCSTTSSTNHPFAEDDVFWGWEVAVDFLLGDGDTTVANLAGGESKIGTQGPWDMCPQSSAPQPPGPSGWVIGHASHAGDDYPYEGMGLFERQEGKDPWNEWYGQCDSFAAWKVYEQLGGTSRPPFRPDKGWAPSDPGLSPVNENTWGNADSWGKDASGKWRVDGNPAPGSIAYWGSSGTGMSVGHVGYVTDVYPNGNIRIEQYNLRLNGEYSTIVMASGGADDASFGYPPFHVVWPTGFIHVHDDPAGTPQTYPTASTYPSNTWGPSSPSTAFWLSGSASAGSDHGWYTRTGHGLIGKELWTNTNGSTQDSTATWKPPLTANRCYTVSTFIPDNYSNAAVTYVIVDAKGTYQVPVNQQGYDNAWAPLGVFQSGTGATIQVQVSDQAPTGFYVGADAMQFVPSSCTGQGAANTIIDPASPAPTFQLYGTTTSGNDHGWYTRSGHGLYGNERWTYVNGTTESSSASWRAMKLNPGACYAVSAFIPDNYANNPETRYTVFEAGGPQYASLDQQAFDSQWALLGTYRADSTGMLDVEVSDIGPSGYVAADAMMFVPANACTGSIDGDSGGGYPTSVYGPGSPQFSTANWWATQPGHGLLGKEEWTHTNGTSGVSRALWTPQLQPFACYAISAYIPDNYANNPQTQYMIADNSTTAPTWVTRNQQSYLNQWARLGTFQALGDGSLDVMVTDQGPIGYYVAADAMQFAPSPCTNIGPSPQPGSGGYPAGTYGPGSAQFSVAGTDYPSSNHGWYSQPGHGLIGKMLWTNASGTSADSTAYWDVSLPQPGKCYDVAAYIPDNYANATVTYRIWTDSPTPAVKQINQGSYYGWADLGTHTSASDGSMSVMLTDVATPGTYIAADAMRFTLC